MSVPTYLVELEGAGASWFDITSYVLSVNISRGRSRELDKFEAGSFSISLRNETRAFDPLYTSSPFYGYIIPKKRIRISSGGVVVFTGYVADWNLSYDVSGQSTANVTGFDAFSYLSNQFFPTFVNTVNKSGTRISALTSYLGISWPGGSTDINAGLETLQADTIATNTNVLEYYQLVERTERGSLFMSPTNVLKFYNYANTGSPKPVTSSVIFSDSGNIGYQNIEIVYGSELLYNSITLSRAGGTTVNEQDAASISLYGLNSYEDSGLLLNTDDDLIQQARYLIYQYSDSEYRFNSVTVMLNPLSGANQSAVLALDLMDTVQVVFTPNKIGSAITKTLRIIGIDHNIDIDQHNITYRFAEVKTSVLILNDSSNGLLDSNVLGM
jgi:hypothetical protein